jgi:hypothetical protein
MESARLNELQRSIKNMKNEASVQHWKDEKWKRATMVIYIYKVDDKAFLFEIINDYYFYTILLEAIVGKERAPKT